MGDKHLYLLWFFIWESQVIAIPCYSSLFIYHHNYNSSYLCTYIIYICTYHWHLLIICHRIPKWDPIVPWPWEAQAETGDTKPVPSGKSTLRRAQTEPLVPRRDRCVLDSKKIYTVDICDICVSLHTHQKITCGICPHNILVLNVHSWLMIFVSMISYNIYS
jgi:hypothetical protein